MEANEQEREREALISWSAVAEPADAAAGFLVSRLGAAAALDWVRVGDEDLSRAAGVVAKRCSPKEARALIRAHERWSRRLDLATQPHERRAAAVGARVLTRVDPGWPTIMDELGTAAPFALWLRGEGDLARLWGRAISVVGSRSATNYGQLVTDDICAGISRAGWTVVSGGAYGIDGAAHRSALAQPAPTIAVMAGGVDRLYPAGHAEMLTEVQEIGCVVAEVPPGYAPHRSRFLSRNRLIAASAATIVVEAALRSGALSTARHAAEMCRPLGAVPGAVTSASSAGCHELVRSGAAILVTRAEDARELVEDIGFAPDDAGAGGDDPATEGSARAPEFDSPHERAAYDALTSRARPMADVARAAGLTVDEARAACAALELRGLAASDRNLWKKFPASLSAKKRT